MKLTLLNTSVVVLAEAHNPTILHPAFLSTQKIVPSDWQLAEPPICTQAISVAKYASNIVFTAEIGKFQIVDTQARREPLITELATRYIEVLPHVHYTAIGVNLTGFAETKTPSAWLQKRFLKEGTWDSGGYRGEAASIRLAYPDQQAILTIDVGTVQPNPNSPPQPCLLFNCNYHSSLSKETPVIDAKRALDLFPQRLKHFESICNLLLSD